MERKEQAASWFREIQLSICEQLEKMDGLATFEEQQWVREAGGGGHTRILRSGRVFEKAGVNFSEVYGPLPAFLAKETGLAQGEFYATGTSIVLHPESPLLPIVHFNTRYFEMSDGKAWYGGGMDLTPIYVNKADTDNFHAGLQRICQRHHPDFYPLFKSWADEYFFIPHRSETRGVGGIFFDHIVPDVHYPQETIWGMVKDLGVSFFDLYASIAKKYLGEPYTDGQKAFQYLRRGRYAEFNLLYDRGTKFGLETGGRTESILMSLPPMATWEYQYSPEQGSPEAHTLEALYYSPG